MKYFFSNELIYCSSITGSLNMCILNLLVFLKIIILQGKFSHLRNFKKWGQNVYFWVSKIAFQLVIFQYLKNHLTKIIHSDSIMEFYLNALNDEKIKMETCS